MRRPLLALAAIPLLLTSAAGLAAEPIPAPAPVMTWVDAGSPRPWGIGLSDLDRTKRPGDDFYGYANGAWEQRYPLRPGQAKRDQVTTLRDMTEQQILLLAEHPQDRQDPDFQAVSTLYRDYLDAAAVEARGTAPLEADLAPLRTADRGTIAEIMGRGPAGFGRAGLRVYVRASEGKDGARPLSIVHQPLGAAVPVYLQKNRSAELEAYRDHVERVLRLAVWPEPARNAAAIVALETDLARQIDRSGDTKRQSWTPADLAAKAPGLDWARFLAAAGVDSPRLVTSEFDPVATAAILGRTPVETLAAWQAYSIAQDASPYLPAAFVAEFARYAEVQGRPMAPRTQQAGRIVETQLNEPLLRLYVKRRKLAEQTAVVEPMVANLRAAMLARIAANPWLTPASKAQAERKVRAMTVILGAPPAYAQPEAPALVPGDLYGNVKRARAGVWAAELREPAGGPQASWPVSRLSLNVFYSTNDNRVKVTGPIINPPFFAATADPAVNYGGLGWAIGAVMLTAIDPYSTSFDAVEGRGQKWTDDEHGQWRARTFPLIAQYSAFEVLPGVQLSGARVHTNSINDLGGLLIALDAYHLSLGGAPAPDRDGFTGDQRFFLSAAQIWRFSATEQGMRRQLATDFRAPGPWRAVGAVRNIDAWYAAFDVQPGDKLYLAPEDRVRIW